MPVIAEALVITERTVGYHLSNIYGKAGVNSRHELTAPASVATPPPGARRCLAGLQCGDAPESPRGLTPDHQVQQVRVVTQTLVVPPRVGTSRCAYN